MRAARRPARSDPEAASARRLRCAPLPPPPPPPLPSSSRVPLLDRSPPPRRRRARTTSCRRRARRSRPRAWTSSRPCSGSSRSRSSPKSSSRASPSSMTSDPTRPASRDGGKGGRLFGEEGTFWPAPESPRPSPPPGVIARLAQRPLCNSTHAETSHRSRARIRAPSRAHRLSRSPSARLAPSPGSCRRPAKDPALALPGPLPPFLLSPPPRPGPYPTRLRPARSSRSAPDPVLRRSRRAPRRSFVPFWAARGHPIAAPCAARASRRWRRPSRAARARWCWRFSPWLSSTISFRCAAIAKRRKGKDRRDEEG